jgi:hypothetical protein
MPKYLLAILAVAALGVSACGSDSSSHDVVPASVPNLTLPEGTAALPSSPNASSADQTAASSGDQTTSTDQSSTPSSTSTGTTPQSTTGTTPQSSAGAGTGGATTPGTTTGAGTTTGTGTTGGASPGEFSKFCQDNPGACPGN